MFIIRFNKEDKKPLKRYRGKTAFFMSLFTAFAVSAVPAFADSGRFTASPQEGISQSADSEEGLLVKDSVMKTSTSGLADSQSEKQTQVNAKKNKKEVKGIVNEIRDRIRKENEAKKKKAEIRKKTRKKLEALINRKAKSSGEKTDIKRYPDFYADPDYSGLDPDELKVFSDSDFMNPFGKGSYRMDCEWSQPRNDGRYNTENGIRWHDGCDLGAKYGTNLYAACNGKVTRVTSHLGGYGGYLEFYAGKHTAPNGAKKVDTWIAYGHISKSFVKPGDIVKKGQCIAQVGVAPTGNYSHLHLEVWLTKPGPASYGLCQYSVDPAFYFDDLYKIGSGGKYSRNLSSRGWGKLMYRPGAAWTKRTKDSAISVDDVIDMLIINSDFDTNEQERNKPAENTASTQTSEQKSTSGYTVQKNRTVVQNQTKKNINRQKKTESKTASPDKSRPRKQIKSENQKKNESGRREEHKTGSQKQNQTKQKTENKRQTVRKKTTNKQKEGNKTRTTTGNQTNSQTAKQQPAGDNQSNQKSEPKNQTTTSKQEAQVIQQRKPNFRKTAD